MEGVATRQKHRRKRGACGAAAVDALLNGCCVIGLPVAELRTLIDEVLGMMVVSFMLEVPFDLRLSTRMYQTDATVR